MRPTRGSCWNMHFSGGVFAVVREVRSGQTPSLRNLGFSPLGSRFRVRGSFMEQGSDQHYLKPLFMFLIRIGVDVLVRGSALVLRGSTHPYRATSGAADQDSGFRTCVFHQYTYYPLIYRFDALCRPKPRSVQEEFSLEAKP